MKHGVLSTVGLVVLGVIVLGAVPAQAQITANGPYYATPSWDQTLPVATRFIVLSNMSSDAVLDRETGLVWQQSASSTSTTTNATNWNFAVKACREALTGNRLGWRLPTAQELASLIDASTKNLPSGNPFNFAMTFYWTATTNISDPSEAWTVIPGGGFGASVFVPAAKTSGSSYWCVRGGQGLDAQ